MTGPSLGVALRHRSLVVRFAALAGVGVALHLVSWTVGYHLLPPEVLRGVFLTSRMPVVGGSEGSTLARILVVNLLFGVGLVVVANLFRVGHLPLGYVPVLFHWTAFGLFQGTGSFTVATAPRPFSLADVSLSAAEWAAIGVALALLVAANWTEARSLVGGLSAWLRKAARERLSGMLSSRYGRSGVRVSVDSLRAR